MKIYVLGAQGMLGRYVYEYLRRQNHDVTGFTRSNFVAPDFEQLKHMVNQESERITIINCIGAIKQKYGDAETLLAINGTFPVKLAKFVSTYSDVSLIHISSDCVFSGKRDGPYVENSVRDATDWYGQSKILGEEAGKYYNCKVLRTSILGEDPKCNKSLLEWVRAQSGKIQGYTNHIWNGVTCLQLAKVCEHVTKKFPSLPESIFNIYSPAQHSKHAIVTMIAELYGVDVNVEACQHAESLNRTLCSLYRLGMMIPVLYHQLIEQKGYLQ